MRKSVQNLST